MKHCKACGGEKKQAAGVLCDKCIDKVFASFQAKCPECGKITRASAGPLNQIELGCGHSMTLMPMIGFESSIKSKVQSEAS